MKLWDPIELSRTLDMGATPSTRTVGVAAAVCGADLADLPDRVRDALAQDTGDRSDDTFRVVAACYAAALTLEDARAAVASRSDLAQRLAERQDDDVQNCWLRAINGSQERRRVNADLMDMVPNTTADAPPEQPPVAVETRPRLKVITASQVQERRVTYVWDGRIPIGSPTLMPGEEGIGKTTVGIRILADLTRGTLPGEFHGEARDVVVMAPEDGIEDVVKPRFREAGADLDRVHFVICREVGDEEDSVILPRDLPLLTEVIRRVDAAVVWVDSLVTVLPDELKSISYKDVNKAMKALGTWADGERVAIVAPWHLNKNAGGDTALRMMDSRAFRTAVRSLLLVVADPDAEEGGPQQGIVALDKANAGTLNVPALRYRIRSARYIVTEVDRYTGELVEKPASCGVADWIGEVAGDGRTIARDALTPKLDKRPSARQWLSQYLGTNGETLRATVIDDGEEAGYSKSAITDAATKIPVSSREEKGQENGVPYRRAFWSLAPRATRPTSVDSHTNRTTRTTGETAQLTTHSICPGQGQLSESSESSVDGETRTTELDDWTTGRTVLVGRTHEEITAIGRNLRHRVLGSPSTKEQSA
ncbi:AAA family ATPase [Geodermatophilus sp. CPCC 205506]|uniref:AAA family ATPase n=1 Tax=Geodermatophilus sp. CPCC 205506 TaxID=2936596 RepID=UPI003EEAD246